MPNHAAPARPMSRKKRLGFTAALTAGLLVAGGGAAFAWWSATGTGSGTTTTGTGVNFTIASSTSGAALTPGGGTQTITFTVSNPGSGPQKLSLITPSIATAAGGSFAVGACSAADYTLGVPAVNYGEIKAGDAVTGTVTIAMVDSGSNQNDCKGVSVPVQFAGS